jgi:hypothetical protein
MKSIFIVFAIVAGFASVAHADVWKWVDANGDTHFVDTSTPIFTWVDESGSVHYSDTPDHEDAISAELIWVAPGSLDDLEENEDEAGSLYPGETEEDRIAREQAEAYYCKRATEIYDSYANAPRLYKTNEAGEREYLSKEEAAKTIAETRAQKDEMCR